MLEKREDVYYYITLLNENYHHPALPQGAEENVLRGLYLLQKSAAKKPKAKVRLLGSGAILGEVLKATKMLADDFGVAADVYSATSFNLLARDGSDCARWNLLHTDKKPRVSHVEKLLGGDNTPVVAATDYVKMFAEQIRQFIPARYVALGTDGFGRSDTRQNLRRHFEVVTVITSLMPPSPLWWATKNWTPKPQKRRSKNIKSTRKPKTRWGCEAGVSVAFLIFCYRVIIPL